MSVIADARLVGGASDEAAGGVSASVVVCTYNRAAKLRPSLDSLLAMTVPPSVRWELVCVDNNSTDNTRQVIEALAKESTIPVKYVFEPVQGLAAARNAGLRAAAGDIIAMTDDDCIVDPGWLAAICREFTAAPHVGIFGGRVELYNPEDLPLTIRSGRIRVTVTPANVFSAIAGCNMAFRRTVVSDIGAFDADFGAGSPLKSAEDIDFIYRAIRTGIKAEYAPDILLHHDHGRRTEDDRKKLIRDYVIGRGAFYMKHILRGDREALRMAYWESRSLLKDAFQDHKALRSGGKNWSFLGLLWLGMVSRLSTRRRRTVPRAQ